MSDQPLAINFEDDGNIPNSHLPLLVYRQVLGAKDVSAEAIEALLATGGWPPRWRWSIYPFHHYHSTAHEVLGVASGSARVLMGGAEGKELEIAAGDVIVIPAGVGHRKLAESRDFLVCGGYPPDSEVDLLKGAPEDRPQALANIAAVPLPETDPVHGPGGPLLTLWT